MSFKTLSALLRGVWLIDHAFAEQQLPLVAAILDGKLGNGLTGTGEIEKPYALNNGQRYELSVFDWMTGKDKPNPDLPDNSIGVLPIIGAVTKYDGDCGVPGTIKKMGWLDQFQSNPKILGVINLIDSPGGQADGTPQFSEAIRAASKPKISLINGGAYSAGYWFASGAPEIYLGHSSDGVGSIGAYTTLMDFKGYFEKNGVKIHEIYPDESADKNLAYRNAMAGDYSLIKAGIAGLAISFREAVANNRGDKLTADDWKTGKVFSGNDAVSLGLADGIINIADAEYRIRELYSEQTKTTVAFNSTLTNQNKMFGNKFTALTALKGKPAADLTAAHLEAVNNQFVEQEINGITAVLDSELEQHANNAETINNLQNQVTAHEATIAAHEATIASLNKKNAAPATAPTTPKADAGAETIPSTSQTAAFEKTSVDLEMEQQLNGWN